MVGDALAIRARQIEPSNCSDYREHLRVDESILRESATAPSLAVQAVTGIGKRELFRKDAVPHSSAAASSFVFCHRHFHQACIWPLQAGLIRLSRWGLRSINAVSALIKAIDVRSEAAIAVTRAAVSHKRALRSHNHFNCSDISTNLCGADCIKVTVEWNNAC